MLSNSAMEIVIEDVMFKAVAYFREEESQMRSWVRAGEARLSQAPFGI